MARSTGLVLLPGSGGVPRSFENFVQHAANLGFHALALTCDNDTSLASFCAADTDPDCYFKVRYEFLTGSNTTSKAVVTRPNSIEFRLAAFLNWLNTNNPAENWGQFLTATNPPWTNALAWNKCLLAGHSQGSGYAGFIGKLQEVERVVMFAGGDWWLRSNQPPAWVLWNDLQSAVWQTAQRPHGVNTNACCTNRAGRPELWAVRRWVSSVSGAVTITGNLAKWDSTGGDGVVGQVRVDGITLWSAFVEGMNVFGTNFSVAANVSVGSFVDFLVSPGPTADADHDGTYFTARITQAPVPPWPVLYIRSLGSNVVELTWEARTNYSYQIEHSVTLAGWQAAGRPLAAPAAPGWMTNVLSLTDYQAFFRLVATPLTDSPVPLAPGAYANLSFTSGGIIRIGPSKATWDGWSGAIMCRTGCFNA